MKWEPGHRKTGLPVETQHPRLIPTLLLFRDGKFVPTLDFDLSISKSQAGEHEGSEKPVFLQLR